MKKIHFGAVMRPSIGAKREARAFSDVAAVLLSEPPTVPLHEIDDEPRPYLSQKEAGAYYTPDAIVASLVAWAVRQASDRLLDPSCGDGRFIAAHRNSVGIEQDLVATKEAVARAPWAQVHESDFFLWASATNDRFECAAGNPPFIRYQTFKGATRDRALRLCARLGATFSGLTSSWAPFLVATAGLLKSGGRLAFVVPAEIGHAPYAAPLLEFLIQHFSIVHVVAIRKKLFPHLSEDCWLLFADDFGGHTKEIRFSVNDQFVPSAAPPKHFKRAPVAEWRSIWKRRLRPYLLPDDARALYLVAAAHPASRRLGDIAEVGIGYVSGANDFFHLRRSDAERWNIPNVFLHPTIRNGRALQSSAITRSTVRRWLEADEPILLLRLSKKGEVPTSIKRYLQTSAGLDARRSYKCRMREPWYSVPDVQVPDHFLSYMSGLAPRLVSNRASCTCTNSVHGVRLREGKPFPSLAQSWESPFVRLSSEIEGHPLGGGMLKLEPREATQILLPAPGIRPFLDSRTIGAALDQLRSWRHYAAES